VGLLPLVVYSSLTAAVMGFPDLRVFLILVVLLYHTSTMARTTGALALAVMLYSEADRSTNISPYWYVSDRRTSTRAYIRTLTLGTRCWRAHCCWPCSRTCRRA
jgi:hypothetical protein